MSEKTSEKTSERISKQTSKQTSARCRKLGFANIRIDERQVILCQSEMIVIWCRRAGVAIVG